MVVSEISLYNAIRGKLGEMEAQAVVEGIKQEVKNEFENKKDSLASKQDLSDLRSDLLRTIYLVGVIQLLGIIGSVIAIVRFMK